MCHLEDETCSTCSKSPFNLLCLVCLPAAGSLGRSRSGRPEERPLSVGDPDSEQVSVKERLAMYQAAVSKKETSGPGSAAVR